MHSYAEPLALRLAADLNFLDRARSAELHRPKSRAACEIAQHLGSSDSLTEAITRQPSPLTELTAPYDGSISRKYIEAFVEVKAGQQVHETLTTNRSAVCECDFE